MYEINFSSSAIHVIHVIHWGLPKILGTTLQGINISHLGKRKIIFKMPFLGGYVNSLEGKWVNRTIYSVLIKETLLTFMESHWFSPVSWRQTLGLWFDGWPKRFVSSMNPNRIANKKWASTLQNKAQTSNQNKGHVFGFQVYRKFWHLIQFSVYTSFVMGQDFWEGLSYFDL